MQTVESASDCDQNAVFWLRACLIGQWTFLVLSLIAYAYFQTRMPEEIRAWIYESEETLVESVAISLSVPVVLFWLYGSIGLYRLRASARRIYLGSLVAASITGCFMGWDVTDALSMELEGIAIALFGATVAISYLTNATKQPTPESEN